MMRTLTGPWHLWHMWSCPRSATSREISSNRWRAIQNTRRHKRHALLTKAEHLPWCCLWSTCPVVIFVLQG